MAININLQDFTATIHKTSRYNNQFDTIHVETFIVTDQPIPTTTNWYIPTNKPLDTIVKTVLEKSGLILCPIPESELQNKIQDATDALNQAKAHNQAETSKDIVNLAVISVMETPKPLSVVEGTQNTYLLSYDYKIFPLEAGSNIFEFKIILPFTGFTMPDNGDEIQITIVTPIGATIDMNNTKGIANDNTVIPAQPANFPTSKKQAISFDYKKDPTFTIRYFYNS